MNKRIITAAVTGASFTPTMSPYLPYKTCVIAMGSHVRLGLEGPYIGKGAMAESSAQQVEKIRRIMTDLSIEIATPTEVRKMLELKGQ